MTPAGRWAVLRALRGVLLAAVAVGLLVMHTQLSQPPGTIRSATAPVVAVPAPAAEMPEHPPSPAVPAMPGMPGHQPHQVHLDGLCLAVLGSGNALPLLAGLLLAAALAGSRRLRAGLAPPRGRAGLARAPTRPARRSAPTISDLCLLRI